MSGRLSGSGVGDLLVDRELVFRWVEEALRSPGVHLLVAEQGFGAPVVVEHCRRVVPEVGVGRCHTGVLVPPMSSMLEACGLSWPALADPVGFVATAGVDGSIERSVPWSEEPASIVERLQRLDDRRPLIVVDGHEALPPVVDVLAKLGGSAGEVPARPVLVVCQPWRDRGHRVDWLDALEPVVASRFELRAAEPDAAWEWFEAATAGRHRPSWATDEAALWAATRGVPVLVGLVARSGATGSSSAFDLAVRVDELSVAARRVAVLSALADVSPLPPGTIDAAVLSGLSDVSFDDVLAELVSVGVVRAGDDGLVRLTDPMWADALLATARPAERRELQVVLLERAIAMGAPPAMVVVHLADVGWSVGTDADRLEDAVLTARSTPAVTRLQWLDLVEQERPSDGADGFVRSAARLAARMECFAALDRPSLSALVAARSDRALRPVDAHPERRGRRAMAFGKLVSGAHDQAIVDLLDLREEVGPGATWVALTADLAMVYLMSGRFALCERSAADAWADLRGEPAVRVVAGMLLATVRLVRGDLASASAVCDEATVMLDLLDRSPVAPLPVHLFASMVRFSTDRHAEALRLLESGLDAARSTGATWALVGHRGLAARLWLRQGNLNTAERLASMAADLPTGADGFRTEGWWAGVLAWLDWLRGADPTHWLSVAGGGPGDVVRVGGEVVGLVSALHLESSGDPVGAARMIGEVFDATLELGAVSALSELLPTAARLAVVFDDPGLRSVVGRVLDIRSLGALEVPSRRASQWAAQAWLNGDVERMRAALDRADGVTSALLAAELASDGELLARRLGDDEASGWFAERAVQRWAAIGVPDVAEWRRGRSIGR
ncbi:MAG: hypothetical protein ACO23O_07790 [Ilumatobacteraceae bacterium]